MALSINPNQTYRLRDLRDDAVPRSRGEPRAPTRRPRFEDKLRDPKAGELVGQFPVGFDKAPRRPPRRQNTLNEATQRMRPRQAVAALMAKEGMSTATKFGTRPIAAAAKESPAWMQLLPTDKDGAKNDDRILEARLGKLQQKQAELAQLERFSSSIDAYSSLEKHMKGHDQRILHEAGRLERALPASGSRESMNVELIKREMAMDQQLNLKYLELQDRLSRGQETLLSNLLKIRSETVKEAISGA